MHKEENKLPLVKDVESRVLDEVTNIKALKSAFMECAQQEATEQRNVRFAELSPEEKTLVVKKAAEKLKNNPEVLNLLGKVRRNYNNRIREAQTERFTNNSKVEFEVLGNLLGRNPQNKDLLDSFHEKLIPTEMRVQIWKALLRDRESEKSYTDLCYEASWKTVSPNEIEITKRCADLLRQHSPGLAYDQNLLNGMKVVLGYFERVSEKRLQDYEYYLLLPIAHTLFNYSSQTTMMVGFFSRIKAIQASICSKYIDENSAVEHFLACVREIDHSIESKIREVLDFRQQKNVDKLKNFIMSFVTRLSCSFFNIETTCFVWDSILLKNTINKILCIFGAALSLISQELEACRTWDDFVKTVKKELPKVSASELQPKLQKVPKTNTEHNLKKVPEHLKGPQYLEHSGKFVLAGLSQMNQTNDYPEFNGPNKQFGEFAPQKKESLNSNPKSFPTVLHPNETPPMSYDTMQHRFPQKAAEASSSILNLKLSKQGFYKEESVPSIPESDYIDERDEFGMSGFYKEESVPSIPESEKNRNRSIQKSPWRDPQRSPQRDPQRDQEPNPETPIAGNKNSSCCSIF